MLSSNPSREDRQADEKKLFRLIQNFEQHALKLHLEVTKNTIDIFKLMDRFGKTPLLYAAYKNSESACRIIIEFALM